MKTICHEHNLAFNIPDINVHVPESGGAEVPENSPQVVEHPREILPSHQLEVLLSESVPLRTVVSRDGITPLSPPYHHKRLRKSQTHGDLHIPSLLFEES